MAIALITASAATIADGANEPGLITQLNTALAPLLTANVRGVSFVTQSEERLIGNEVMATITYDTSGALMANPFVAVAFQSKTADAVKVLIDAFVAANPGYFYSTVWIQPLSNPRYGGQYVGLLFYNVNLAQGAANWAVNGGGTVTAVRAAQTIFVDSVYGNDATGQVGNLSKPFLTLMAAKAASNSLDSFVVRPGLYQLTGTQTLVVPGQTNQWWFDRGAIVQHLGLSGIIFDDQFGVTALVVRGHGWFTVSGASGALAKTNVASNFDIECDIVHHDSTGTDCVLLTGATTFRLVSPIITSSGVSLVSLHHNSISVVIEADTIVVTNVVDDATGGVTVSVKALSVTVTGFVCQLAGAPSAMKFDCDEIISNGDDAFRLNSAGNVVEVRAVNITCTGLRCGLLSGGNTSLVMDVEDTLTCVSAFVTSNTDANVHLSVGNAINASNKLVDIGGGRSKIFIECLGSITANRVLVDNASTGATQVSIKAVIVTATGAGVAGVDTSTSGGPANGSRYDITADVLTCSVSHQLPGGELHVHAGTHTPHTNLEAFNVAGSAVGFTSTDECKGNGSFARPLAVGDNGSKLHVLRGRIVGANDAAGAAVAINHDSALLRLYPGAVLVAGAAAANSIAIGGSASIPTVLAMGAIAANKAAAAGIVIAVGSLLVDPLVV